MLKDAVALAAKYTFPVILSRQNVKGDCSSNIGAFVVVNHDGWIATAGHIVEHLSKMVSEAAQVAQHEAQLDVIANNPALSHKDKQKAKSALGHLGQDLTKRSGAWWGMPNPDVELTQVTVLPTVDLAVGKLDPFDPTWVTEYPRFKDPATPIKPGTTLCKFGYPFHALTPVWNAAANRFDLPASSMPPPSFPMEGIATQVWPRPASPVGPAVAFPLEWIVTSSPGLRGQSGGPIFDIRGVVCAIQCQTWNLALGFDPDVPGKPGVKEHQFLNVGVGVHPKTFCGLFNDLGVAYVATPD